jgi:hypothetical protein
MGIICPKPNQEDFMTNRFIVTVLRTDLSTTKLAAAGLQATTDNIKEDHPHA